MTKSNWFIGFAHLLAGATIGLVGYTLITFIGHENRVSAVLAFVLIFIAAYNMVFAVADYVVYFQKEGIASGHLILDLLIISGSVIQFCNIDPNPVLKSYEQLIKILGWINLVIGGLMFLNTAFVMNRQQK